MSRNPDTAAKVQAARALMAPPQNLSRRAAALQVGLPESTLRYHLAKSNESGGDRPTEPAEEPAGIERTAGDVTTMTVRSAPRTGSRPSPEDVLKEHGIDPDAVEIVRVRANQWGDPDNPKIQLRVDAVPKTSLIQIPDPGTWNAPDLGCIEDFAHGSVLFRADPHLPYNDEALNRSVLRYINSEEPGLIVFLGDLADFSVISRHRTHSRFAAMVNHTNDSVTRHLWETRQAAPNAEIVVIPGNHDARLLYLVQDYASALEGARPGSLPGDAELPAEALGFRKLWRLDELGIKLVDEDWKLASFAVAPELTARHGYLTGNNAERKLLEKHGRSQVHGHTHRLSLTYRTKHDPLDIRVSMDCGTEADVQPDGLGYEPDPDWQPGVGVGHVWEDGTFVLSPAPFINENLLLPSGFRISGKE